MLDDILEFLAVHDLCVLATAAGGVPHCSLMAYALDRDRRHLLLATLPDTRKWRNLQENPEVSILVDNREALPDLGRDALTAVTLSGRRLPFHDPAGEKAAKTLLAGRHGSLGGILDRPETRAVRIRILTLQVLKGPIQATRFTMSD